MNERIKLPNGWVVHIQSSKFLKGSYTIEKIEVLFAPRGIWFDIDLTKLTQEQWDIFHELLKEVRNESELDKHYQRLSEGFIPKEAKTCE
jgi:two-component SAPR family response regulator